MRKRGPLNVRLGENLRALRVERGLTQEGLAEMLEYDRTYVAGVERGERNLTLDTMTVLAGKLGIDPLELLVETHHP